MGFLLFLDPGTTHATLVKGFAGDCAIEFPPGRAHDDGQGPQRIATRLDAAPAIGRTPRVSFMNIVVDVVRHLVPLLPLYLFNGNIAGYLLLTAFDLSLGLMLIVGTTRDRGDVTSVDPRSRWLVMRLTAVLVAAVFLAIIAAIIAIPIGMPAYMFGLSTGIDWGEG